MKNTLLPYPAIVANIAPIESSVFRRSINDPVWLFQ